MYVFVCLCGMAGLTQLLRPSATALQAAGGNNDRYGRHCNFPFQSFPFLCRIVGSVTALTEL